RLRQVKTFFDEDEHSCLYLHGPFVDYSTTLYALRARDRLRGAIKEVHSYLESIVQDIWNIGSLIERLEWMVQLTAAGQLTEDSWRMFAALDIEHFHIEVRSILDYAALSIRAVSGKKSGQLPDSFRKLRQGCTEKNSSLRRK